MNIFTRMKRKADMHRWGAIDEVDDFNLEELGKVLRKMKCRVQFYHKDAPAVCREGAGFILIVPIVDRDTGLSHDLHVCLTSRAIWGSATISHDKPNKYCFNAHWQCNPFEYEALGKPIEFRKSVEKDGPYSNCGGCPPSWYAVFKTPDDWGHIDKMGYHFCDKCGRAMADKWGISVEDL